MSAAQNDFQKRFRYHHGNLRESLLAAALDIVEQGGVEALSLRVLAKATGVTQAAPYSHFRDKEDLLAAVAETGFQRLALQMAEDATGAPSVEIRIQRLAESYARFALAHKALFRLMFGRELAEIGKYPTLAMTAGKSYGLISTALAGRSGDAVETRFLTVAVWSLCHGLTTLLVDGKLTPETLGVETASDLVKKTVSLLSPHLQ